MEKEARVEKRNYEIDFLKVLGLLLIILAHTKIPKIASQFRSFDVPLMVIISAILAKKTYNRETTIKYWKKRYFRLVIPTHIFLVSFFIIMFLFSRENLTYKLMVNSFLLLHNSIGYVWIILVYFMCALLIPIIDKIDITKKNIKIGIVIIYLLYEILVYFKFNFTNNLFYSIFYFIIPYGIITILGYHYDKLTKKNKLYISISCLIFNIVFMLINLIINQKYVLYTDYKYPPTFYFLSYGVFMSILLIEVVRKRNMGFNKLVNFISQNSLWIYLVHILVLKLLETLLPNINWMTQYILIVEITLVMIFMKNLCINVIEKKAKVDLKILKG